MINDFRSDGFTSFECSYQLLEQGRQERIRGCSDEKETTEQSKEHLKT